MDGSIAMKFFISSYFSRNNCGQMVDRVRFLNLITRREKSSLLWHLRCIVIGSSIH